MCCVHWCEMTKDQMTKDHTTNGQMTKEEKYLSLVPEIRSLLSAEPDMTAKMANFSSMLHLTMGFWWTGFYRVEGSELVLGPFQGPVACTRIAKGKGVCGTAWKEARTIVVPDVEQFPGHIACSSESRSEIVVPVWRQGSIVALLDIDSRELGSFDQTDSKYLEMMVAFLSSTESIFDSIAPDYDRLNHLLSLGTDRIWRHRSLKWVVDRYAEQKILDIACGTGDFSIAIAGKSHPDTSVTGLDLSEGMLAVMRNKVVEAGLDAKISAMQGNCEKMPFPDDSFDVATIAFGIRNFQNRDTALKEILRVLKPGGRLVILELSVPSNSLLRYLYNLYFSGVLPLVGGRISGNRAAYRYLPASVLKFPGKNEWIGIMERNGFSEVFHKSFTLGICRMYSGKKEYESNMKEE